MASSSPSHRLLLLPAAVAICGVLCVRAAAAAEDDDLSYLMDNTDDIPAGDPEGWLHKGSPDDDVVVLADGNLPHLVAARRHVMVESYAPWCGHFRALAPEYVAAAAELKGEDVVLAKVDATEENDLAQKYDIQGFPTLLFFVNGVHKDYPGARSKDAIVAWIKKKLRPGVQNATTAEEVEKILTAAETAAARRSSGAASEAEMMPEGWAKAGRVARGTPRSGDGEGREIPPERETVAKPLQRGRRSGNASRGRGESDGGVRGGPKWLVFTKRPREVLF